MAGLGTTWTTSTGSPTGPRPGPGRPLSWGAGGPPNGLARDLRLDDALLPTYTSAPLEAPVEILGFAGSELAIEATMPVATAVVRLADVAPDGTAAQVAAGVLNLTHRDSHASPAPLEPGRRYDVRVPLRAAGYRFAPGHRIRLSVASAYWPVLWPSPCRRRAARSTAWARGSSCRRSPPGPVSSSPPAFKTSPAGVATYGGGSAEPPVWRIVEDVIAGTVTVSTNDAGETSLPDGTVVFAGEQLEMTASDADPAHARMANRVDYRLDQDGVRDRRPGVGRDDLDRDRLPDDRPARGRPRRRAVLPARLGRDHPEEARVTGRISARAASFTESVIREMNRLAVEAGAVSLAQGFPDFESPCELREAAVEALHEDISQYAITWGAKPLRAAIAAKTCASTPTGSSTPRPRSR